MHKWSSSGSITIHEGNPESVSAGNERSAECNDTKQILLPSQHHTPDLDNDATEELDHIKVCYKETGCCHMKYSNALKHFLPCRPNPKVNTLVPSNDAGLFSYFSVNWLTGLMWKAYRQGLNETDLWDIQEEDGSEICSARLERIWDDMKMSSGKEKTEPQLFWAVWHFMRTRVLVGMFVSFISNILGFLGPSVLLKIILDYINEPEVDVNYAIGIVVAVGLLNLVRGATFNAMFVIGTHTATRITGAIQAVIYKKCLRLKAGGEKLSAQIINICNNDMERIFEASLSCVFITAMPVYFILSVVYSVYVIGPWSILGMGIYMMFYPVMAAIARFQSRLRVETVKVTDRRVALMSEILNSIRLIKMYSWEDSFSKKIAGIRRDELKRHKVGALLQAISSTIIPSISILATIATFLGYTLTGHSLSAPEAFTIFSVFNSLQFTMGVLPFTIRSIAEARVSIRRIQQLLALPEHDKVSSELCNGTLALQINKATFAWEVYDMDLITTPAKDTTDLSKNKAKDKSKEIGEMNGKDAASPLLDHTANNAVASDKLVTTDDTAVKEKSLVKSVETLFDIDLHIEGGRLIGICGSIGAGKSSLVSAICGDMKLQSGDVSVKGSLAVVSQQAWIYNDTLRGNITLGNKFDEELFQNVIDSCSLRSDIQQLPSGDRTEIGERGVNLSGGQKQRVNLGRAVYSDRDIYLLDDPLSAVDTKVANHIFHRCIRGALKDKTVLLITHATHFLEQCDEIILMQKGCIAERGSHDELMEKRGEYYDLLSHENDKDGNRKVIAPWLEEVSPRSPKKKSSFSGPPAVEDDQLNGRLISEEKKESGRVSSKVYITSIKVSGGWCMASVILDAVVVFTLCRIFNNLWLQIWLDQGDGLIDERRENETLYNTTYSDSELKGDITQNPQLWMYQLVYALSFVVLMVTGVIKGVWVTYRVLAGATHLHNAMFNSIMRSPISFFDVTPAGRILTRFSRDLDELDVRVPFFLEFVLQGFFIVIAQILLVCFLYVWFFIPLLVIAALFICIDIIMNCGVRELKRLDNTLRSPVVQHIGSSITGMSVIRTFDRGYLFTHRFYKYVDKHSSAILVFRLANRWFTFRMDMMASIVTLCITVICVFSKGIVSTATAGLALSMVNGICAFIPFFMRMKSEFQSRLTSVERIIEYAYELDCEAPREMVGTPSDWPNAGAIEMKDVTLRYRPDLPLVLHGVNATIKAGEKIGIVGRTGAGKTSLVSTILRITELDSGNILIDGIDITTVGLHQLRSSISVIPQDPVLFQGSLRYNLDPFDEHSDERLWEALERSHLKALVQGTDHSLQSEVQAAGENFSVGERQLICLTRALLRNSKILLLDEATASVDIETDQLIQTTIRDVFATGTVLTIAHRLNTVANYDRIMVMDSGVVKEFDIPENLMEQENSLFRDMMKAIGVTTVEEMKRLK